MQNKYLVLVDEEFVDGTAFISKPEGVFGGEGYIETKNSLPLVLGEYTGEDEDEAISKAALHWESSKDVLRAVKLIPNHSPLEEAIRVEIDYIVNDSGEYDDEPEFKKHVSSHLDEIVETVLNEFEDFNYIISESLFDHWWKNL